MNKDITICSSSHDCPKRKLCIRAIVIEENGINRSIADFYQDYDHANCSCPAFWDYRDVGDK